MASSVTRKANKAIKPILVTSFTLVLLMMFLSPFAFMVFTSLKTPEQISVVGAPIWPAAVASFEYNGKEVDMYTVPLNTCEGSENHSGTAGLALVKKGTRASTFVDPDHLERGEFVCQVSWRALDRPWKFSPTFNNYKEVWDTIQFPRLLWNTTFYAIMSTIGVLISCTFVAYGFSRFDFPGRDFLFVVLIATIFLPGFVTLIPTYTFFQRIGWVGTWLPLIVPTFFGNAFDVFLLRQYFMTIPREMDEAAMIDGASRFRILWSVIVPQSYPVLLAVTVFHIVYAWNDFFGPLIYLSTNRAAWPVSVALNTFNGIYGQKPQLIQAGALMTLLLPLLLFIFAQRFFVQGIVITGVDK
ncbi:MAG: carbohydrate ABC transporter permease [Anaerolineae bacterium]|nr:carbohydrate ABC transporter permease [Anaerolineae bacterium]MCB9133439.1 carbohydrate ABC transporter permease [Anaerolineales bacterium]MCB0234913.1 carbohydrate ABC transporter permease [Anaerolineae bacterium]MCB0237759.1 carbohydrate ABC transporter permease [Anaerolineae bacterium]MCB0244021.1 carbohydrate ABC transporter permease [Anaerolineae bacterium]